MCTHRHKAPNGVYYFRMSIPEALRPAFDGKREIKFSLRTKDPIAAKALIPDHTKAAYKLLEDARRRLGAETVSTPVPSSQALSEAMRRMEEQEASQRADDDEQRRADAEREARIEDQEEYARELRTLLTGSTAAMHPKDAVIVRAIRDAQGDADFYRQLVDDRELALRYVRDELKARDRSKANKPIAVPAGGSPSSIGASTPSVTVSGLFDSYAASAKNALATVDQWRAYINHLVAFLGHDDAGTVTTDDLLRWRQYLRDERFRDGKPRSSKTINGSYLAAASVTFRFGFAERILPTNPMQDVPNLRADRKPKLRDKDFSHAERKLILSAALRPHDGKLSVERALARRWVPWICAYTGARVNEATQLRKEDFQERDGIWCVLITPEAGGVKTDEARYVPVHEHLVEQGLLKVIAKAKAGPLFYNPAVSGGGKRAQYKIVGQRLAEWVRDIGVTDPNVQPNHAWRHTFKTICQEAGIEERAADYMQGHASKGQGRRYGSNTLPALAEQLKKFPRHSVE